MEQPRAKTKEEVREEFLSQVHSYVEYWQNESRSDEKGKVSGVAFSILALIDGDGELPAMDIVMRPHPSDEAYFKEKGENWIPDGLIINDVPLHEQFYK
jgi:hypothetical protein